MATFVYAALFALGVTLLVITAVRLLVGGIAAPALRTSARPPSGGSARGILDARYAAGELSTEEYQHPLRVLEGGDR